MVFEVTEEIAEYDPALRLSWQEGGSWPHSNHFHFNEAVVAAYLKLRGYHVLRDFSSTRLDPGGLVAPFETQLLHAVVGPEVSDFFRTELADATACGTGEPDLFVFREEHQHDPKVRYLDPRLWFFVEVKGPGDVVQPAQKAFWHEVAKRGDLGLGPDRIRLFRTVPIGALHTPGLVEY